MLQSLSYEQLQEYYEDGYYCGENQHVYRNYLENEATKRAGFRERLLGILKTIGVETPGKCLEIGCAFGLFIDEARKLGWDVQGTEMSEYAAEHARSKLGLDVRTGNNALRSIGSASHDVVFMWDVIEHLSDPLSALIEIKRILVPGGSLVLSTGDARSLGARIFGKRWFLVMPPYHLFYFDRQSIAGILRTAGFTTKRIWGDGHPLENMGKYPVLQWLAQHDRYVGWRVNSGPIMTVTAVRV